MQHQMFAAVENYIEAEHKEVTYVHVNDSQFEIHYQSQKMIVRYDPSQYIYFGGYGYPAGYFSFDQSPDGIFNLVLNNRQPMDVVTASDHLVALTMKSPISVVA